MTIDRISLCHSIPILFFFLLSIRHIYVTIICFASKVFHIGEMIKEFSQFSNSTSFTNTKSFSFPQKQKKNQVRVESLTIFVFSHQQINNLNNIRCKCFKSYFHTTWIYWVLIRQTEHNKKNLFFFLFSNLKKIVTKLNELDVNKTKKNNLIQKKNKEEGNKKNVLYQIKSMFLTMILTRIDLSTHSYEKNI